MRDLTPDETASLETCGRVGFTWQETAAALDLDPDEVKSQFAAEQGDVYTHWTKGRLQAELELRLSIFEQAKAGAAPMLERMLRYYQKTDTENRDL